jgi:hypothetical protein
MMPQQNGVAERMNRTLLEKIHCMISNAKLIKDFWTEAVSTVCYIVNHASFATLDFKAPEKVWSDTPPNYFNLKVFGCPVYKYENDEKLELRVKKCRKDIDYGVQILNHQNL